MVVIKKIQNTFVDKPELFETYRYITGNDNLRLLFDSTKDLEPIKINLDKTIFKGDLVKKVDIFKK